VRHCGKGGVIDGYKSTVFTRHGVLITTFLLIVIRFRECDGSGIISTVDQDLVPSSAGTPFYHRKG
jgi:hypothetical protein